MLDNAQNILSSAEERKFGMRWGWDNDNKIFFEVGNQGYTK